MVGGCLVGLTSVSARGRRTRCRVAMCVGVLRWKESYVRERATFERELRSREREREREREERERESHEHERERENKEQERERRSCAREMHVRDRE